MNISSSISSAEVFEQLTRRSLAAFFVYNLQTHRLEYLNAAFEEIWECSIQGVNEDLPSLLSTVFKEDVPLVHKSYERLKAHALRQSLEFRIQIGGREKWINLTAYAIVKEGERRCLAGFAEEITHSKQNEIFTNKMGSHKDAILEMLSHDLGGPLGIALQLAGLIKKQSTQHEHIEIQQNADLIRKTLQHSIHLIDDYLQKEYIESTQNAIKKQRVEIIEQLAFMLEGFKRMDIAHHKHFHLETSSPQIFVEVDQVKFHQIITNLVSNANKFTRENGHITIVVQQQEKALLIRVSDDGIGIPLCLQEELFRRMSKAARTGLHGEQTHGVGLSIVKSLVEMHQGKVWVESEENKGTTFFVEIPY